MLSFQTSNNIGTNLSSNISFRLTHLAQILRTVRGSERSLRQQQLEKGAAPSLFPQSEHTEINNCAQAGSQQSSGRVFYVLFSGMNDNENYAATNVRNFLLKQGVETNQIIVTSNPVVTFKNPCNEKNRSFWKRLADCAAALIVNVQQYFNYSSRDSGDSRLSCSEVKLELRRRQYSHGGSDKLILIGHSMGGQRAITTAELLSDANINVSLILTLGSPITSRTSRTKVTALVSTNDPILLLCNVPGGVLHRVGSEAGSAVNVPKADHLGYLSQANLDSYLAPLLD